MRQRLAFCFKQSPSSYPLPSNATLSTLMVASEHSRGHGGAYSKRLLQHLAAPGIRHQHLHHQCNRYGMFTHSFL